MDNLRVAVLSGKGGTGKTLVAVNLAALKPSVYVDCDVEAPNGHLFFKPRWIDELVVEQLVPVVDAVRCTGCRTCTAFCRFSALAYTGNGLMVFNEVCHSCGGCILLCPQQALSEQARPIGSMRQGISGDTHVLSGSLNTGESQGVPVVRAVLAAIPNDEATVFIDCPPGSSCLVMESLNEADYCVLVAEPTIFGRHNLMMVVELVQRMGKPFGVLLNKCLPGVNPSMEYCRENNLLILGEIPYDPILGELNGDGDIAVQKSITYAALFADFLEKILKEVHHEAVAHP